MLLLLVYTANVSCDCIFVHPLLIRPIRCCMLGFSSKRITDMVPVLTSVFVCVCGFCLTGVSDWGGGGWCSWHCQA